MMKATKNEKLLLEKLLEKALVKEEDRPYKVPLNWVWTKLTSGFAKCLDNFREPINATERANREGDIPYYGATGQVGWIDDYLTDEQLVLVGEDGAPFFDLIKNKAYIIEGKAWVNNHAHILKSFYGTNGNKYLMYYLNTFDYRGYVNGTTRLKLTQSSMNCIPIPLPPLAEQLRIVVVIESLFKKLDSAKQLAQDAIDSFESRKASIMHKAFTGELTAKWRKENGVSLDEWEKTIIGNLCDCVVPGRDKPKSFTGTIPWITTPNIEGDYICTSSAKLLLTIEEVNEVRAKIIPIGSVIMSCVGRFGLSAIVENECVINQQLHAFLQSNLIVNKFLMYNIRYLKDYMSNKSTSTTIAYLNKTACNSLPINLPSLIEQSEIVRILEYTLENEQRAKELCDVIQKIDFIKKVILARAFRGELGTNDSQGESAMELLKEVLIEKM